MTTTVRLLATYQGNRPQTIVRLPDALAASLVAGGNATLDLTGGINTAPPPVARVDRGPARLIYSATGAFLGLGDSAGNLLLNTSGAATPTGATKPGAPTAFTLTAAAGAVIGAFTAPASNGGDPIQWYEMTLSDGTVVRGDASPIAAAAPAGVSVSATVRAVNGIDKSDASNSASATPTGVAPSVPATAITLTGPTTATVGTASSAYTVALSPVGGTVASPVTVTPTAVAGVTYTPASVTLTTASPSATFTATASTAGTKSIAVTSTGGLTAPASINLVVAASGTAPAVTSSAAITGTPQQGVPLAITSAVFSGSPTPTVTRVIKMDGAQVASGTQSTTYTPVLADVGKIPSVTDTAANGVGSAASSTGAGAAVIAAAASATLRQVATSTFINSFQHPNNISANSRSPHYMRAAVSTMQIVLPNWYVLGQAEANGSGTDTYKAALEYPEGTFTQITFGGSASGVVAPGDNLISDAVAAPPKDAKFWIRLNLVTTGRIKFQLFYAGDGTAQLEAATTALADKTMGGTFATVASKDAGMIMPCAIIANSTVPAFGIYGDSISVGRGDTATANVPLQGHLGRSFGAQYPTGHVGVSGDTLAGFLASNAKRIDLAKYFTHVPFNMGINSVTNGATAAQVQADTNSFIGLFGSRPVAACTMSPVSTGTWTTVAGQTTVASNSVRAAVNTQRLTNLPLAKVVYDVNPVVENVTNPEDGLWNITGGPNTDDGTHHNANSATRIAAAINPALLLA